jgi:hypothetical protein
MACHVRPDRPRRRFVSITSPHTGQREGPLVPPAKGSLESVARSFTATLPPTPGLGVGADHRGAITRPSRQRVNRDAPPPSGKPSHAGGVSVFCRCVRPIRRASSCTCPPPAAGAAGPGAPSPPFGAPRKITMARAAISPTPGRTPGWEDDILLDLGKGPLARRLRGVPHSVHDGRRAAHRGACREQDERGRRDTHGGPRWARITWEWARIVLRPLLNQQIFVLSCFPVVGRRRPTDSDRTPPSLSGSLH